MSGNESEGARGASGTDESADELEERRVMCSGCFQVVPESRIHVIPFFNTDIGAGGTIENVVLKKFATNGY